MEFIYISQICFFISLILLLVQGIINYKFYEFNKTDIIEERTIYEQFAYEVYSSINKLLPLDIKIRDECSSDEEQMELNLDLNSYYDCRGVYNIYSCENKVINNYTLCSSDEISFQKNWNDYKFDLDIDNRQLCTFFSNYNRKINKLNGKQFCKLKNKFLTYEFLLSNSHNECKNRYKKCGYLDTYNNILCIPHNYSCPKNSIEINQKKSELDDNDLIYNPNKKVINSIIISQNEPLKHEWDLMVRETYEKINDENIQKRRELSENFHKNIDTTYQIIENLELTVNNITIGNNIRDINSGKYNLNEKLNIYTRSYIGFKNVKELNKFKEKFNDQDYKDNPLYKLSSKGHHPLVTIIISVIFICAIFAYFILYCTNKLSKDIYQVLFAIFGAFIGIFFLGELIIIGVHFNKYKKIYIDMDKRMKEVLEKYNERRLTCQLYRIISLSINVVSIVFFIISYYKDNKQ